MSVPPITGHGTPAYPALDASQVPFPASPAERARWEEGRRRRRMMDGLWREDLERRMLAHFGSVRREALGPMAMAINVASNVCREMGVLYDQAPTLVHQLPGAAVELGNRVRLAGLWQVMQSVQPMVLACREYLVRGDVDERGRLRYRPVPPDMVIATSSTGAPDVPISVDEVRPRMVEGEWRWTMDRLSVEDPEAPVYQVLLVDKDLTPLRDITADALGADYSGDAYPYRTRTGEPVLPYVLYHAQRPGDRLWDPYAGVELWEGTLDAAAMYQMLVHVYRDASWPQRWVLGARVAGLGADMDPTVRRAEIVTDQSTLLHLEATPDAQGQPQVGQWQAGGDPVALEEVLANMIARLATDAGIPPSDVQRLGGTARSGVAISLTNEGKRSQQRRYAAVFRDADERLMRLSAILVNRATGSNLPESGYEVVYQQIPLSPAEMEARRKHALELVAAGLMSKAEAYAEMHPGMSLAGARQALAAIAAEEDTEDAPSAPPSNGMAEGEDTEEADTEAEMEAMVEEMASEAPDMEAVQESARAIRTRRQGRR